MITSFHAHIYFSPETRTSALALKERLAAAAITGGTEVTGITIGRFHEVPVGPHLLPMFTVVVPHQAFTATVSWLMLEHGPHSVLIHPETGDDRADHSIHALWLGERLELDFSKL